MEIDNRLLGLIQKGKKAKVSEDEFRTALKGYKFDEFLIALSELSIKLFNPEFSENKALKKEKVGFIVHKDSKQFVTDFAIEYIANILLISGSNNFKRESIKNKDNIISLFSIYHNAVMQPIDKMNSMQSIMVPMYYQQITSQQNIKDVFVRQWLIFQKSQKLVNKKNKIDLDQILIDEIGVSVIEYIKLCFLILTVLLTRSRFNLKTFENSNIHGLGSILDKEKISAILKHLSATQNEFIELDKKYNSKLKPEYTKSRYNPLWEKPIIKLLRDNDYVAPSLSAYVKGAIKGLYWIFENSKGKTFRDYFGTLFENYCGMIIQDIFGTEDIKPGIKYGKENKEFFDWIVDKKSGIILFETKGYQFPLNTLQTGNPKLIKKEVFRKLVETIKQTYKRYQDIHHYKELKEFENKKITIIVVFYDIPLVSTSLYDSDIKLALEGLSSTYPGIKNFKYIFLSIEELESYAYVKGYNSIESIVTRVRDTPGSGILSEISKIFKENNLLFKNHKSLLDKKFEDFYNNELGINYSKK